jgi:cell division cycle protein 20 (cofactor of APC complex)
MVKNVEIAAHESRVLHSCLSPDGQIMATAAADESLKFWKIFEKKASSSGPRKDESRMEATMTIR